MVKALQFDTFGLENLKVVDRILPEVGEGQVRVKVHAVSLNYRDYLMVKGHYNPRLKLPLIPCSDGAGEVVEVGPGVTDLEVGDSVCTTMIPDWQSGLPGNAVLQTTLGGPEHGMCAQERVLPQNAVMKLPDVVSYEEGACLPVAGLTAWSSLVTEGHIRKGSKVLLLGTGGVSIMALGIANKLGAQVVITSSSDDKLGRARAMGAKHTINYRKEPRWDKVVREIYPEGVDLVLEVGGDGTFDASVKCVRNGGTIALIGVLAQQNKPVNLTHVLMRRIRVQGILVGCRDEFAEYLDFVDQERPACEIDAVFEGLESAGEAFAMMERGGHFGKIVLTLRG